MVRVGGFFSGIGAHHSACMRAGIPGVEFQVKWQCDIDPYKVDAYNRMHGEVPNLGDISEVRDLDGEREIDLLFYTPSCQNISAAGRKEGNTEGSGTSSSLVFEVPRILAATKARPSVLIMEEVPMMVAKRFKANFDIILERLSELGYRHSWKVVNATDFGVGQNRRRLICVSVLGREPPVFPEPKGSFRPLRDYLEPSGAVPDSYFLTEERLKGVIWSSDKESGRGNGFRFQPCPPPLRQACKHNQHKIRTEDKHAHHYRSGCL